MARPSLKGIPLARIARWATVGFLFMGFNLPVLYLLVDVLQLELLLATLITALIGTSLRFLVNDRLVFGHPRPTLKRLRTYYVANAFALGIWYAVANLLPRSGLHYLLAAPLATCCSFSVSLATNFLWVWSNEPDRPAPESDPL